MTNRRGHSAFLICETFYHLTKMHLINCILSDGRMFK